MVDEINDNVYRRLENLENSISEIKKLIGEIIVTNNHHNELILELKELNKEQCKRLLDMDSKYDKLNVEISNVKLGFSAITWVTGSIIGTAIVLVMNNLFKNII